VDVWTVYELVQGVFIQSFDKVVEKHLVKMRCRLVPLGELVRCDIEQLIVLLAGALGVQTLQHVYVDNTNHCHSVGLVVVDSLREIGHVVDLDQCVNIYLHFVDAGLNKVLNSILS